MTAIVTGSSDGIGKETALALCRAGYTVYGISKSETRIPGVRSLLADVCDPQSLRAVIERVPSPVDVLVCSAGVSLASPAAFTELRDARHVYDVNFWGCVHACAAALPAMRAGGRIVFISSMAGQIPLPYLAFYSSSKAALEAYAQALHMELRPFRIAVTAIAPGGVRTQLSQKRIKYDNRNAPGLHQTIAALGREEQTGMPPVRVAAAVLRNLKKRRPSVITAVGGRYRVFALIQRISPKRLLLRVVAAKYAGS